MWKWVVLAVVALLVVGTTLKLTVFNHQAPQQNSKNPTTLTGSQNTKGEASTGQKPLPSKEKPQTDNTTSAFTKQPGDQKSNNVPNASLVVPSGDFVSNHDPGENDSQLIETSVCNTTAGATCQITFTKDGVTKSLPAQVTDRGGSTYWDNWAPSDVGLTAGSWKIQAVASLNGQTKSASDAIPLVVPQ